MPNPGSHHYDVRRTRLRAENEDRGEPDQQADRATSGSPIALRSPAFSDHTLIPERYSYEGENISPPLEWSGIPDGAGELVLLCEDPDAPTGVFTHWILLGIAPTSTGIPADAVPQEAVEGRNDFGELGWAGPRPPVGDEPHRYFFRLHALDRALGLIEGATGQEVRAAISGHTITTGTLVGLYGR